MPLIERFPNDSQQSSMPEGEGAVTALQEFELLQAAHNNVSAAKNYKTKLKIEDKKKQEETRKNYDAVIHNMVVNNIHHIGSVNHAAQLTKSKAAVGVAI